MEWTFSGEVFEWRGPAPYLFVAMTREDSEDVKEEARGLIYWGEVPVHVAILDELPRTASSKVSRVELTTLVQASRAAEATRGAA